MSSVPPNPDPDSDDPPPVEPVVVPRRRFQRVSLVWAVPLLAICLGFYLAFSLYRGQGPTVTIIFDNAEGLVAGKTPIRYRDVNIGVVEDIRLSEDLETVVVQAKMDPDTRRYLNNRARFWVVRPRVGTSGVSGLGTLLSGAYIQVNSVTGGEFQKRFVGLEQPPLTPENAPGMQLVLRSDQAGYVSVGSPVYYREVKVGQIEARRFLDDYQGVEFDVFIDAPHHEIIRNTTRFWYISGFDFTVNSDGFRVNTPSLEALAQGGVAFDVIEEFAFPEPVESGHTFTLYESQTTAREAILRDAGKRTEFTVYFDGSVRGLSAGAPVEFRGVQIGTVTEVRLTYDEILETVRVPVVIELQPERVRGFQDNDVDEGDLIKQAITQGLRAKLQTGNLLTGQLYVALDMYADNGPKHLAKTAEGMDILPSVPSDLDQITEGVQETLAKLNALPLEDLLATAVSALGEADALLGGFNEQDLPGDVDGVMYATDATIKEYWRLASDSRKQLDKVAGVLEGLLDTSTESVAGIAPDSPLYYNVLNTLKDIQAAAKAVQLVAESVERKPEEFLFGK
jgi:paraquat-inducible protein B